MEAEKKKELLALVKECDDAEFLRQISITADAITDAHEAIENYKEVCFLGNKDHYLIKD